MCKLIVVTRSMYAGGAERVIAQLVNYFSNKKIDCKIVTIDNEIVLYDLEKDVALIPIGKKSDFKIKDKIQRYLNLRKIINKENPDVILSMPEDIGVYVILALLGLKISVFVSERNNPWVMPDVKVTRFLRKLMYPLANGIIFQTEMAKSFFPQSVQKKGIVLSNPIDERRIPVPYDGKRKRIIVGAGRLDKQKNFPVLIRAFKKFSIDYPEYELKIYGEGKLREQLEILVNELGISDKVELPGRINNLLEEMNSAAMFVLSSDYEGMPNVLLEAMCMGMPVISTDCPSGGPVELIENEVNGILVPVNNINALYNAMKMMVDESFSSKAGHNAFKIRDKCTNYSIFEKWEDYLFEK